MSYTSSSLYGGSPWVVEADFTGQSEGDLIRQLQFSSLKIGGTSINSIDSAVPMYGDFGEAILSFSGKSNDFWLYGRQGAGVSASLRSYTAEAGREPDQLNAVLYFANGDGSTDEVGLSDFNLNASWTVTAVPEPETYTMLLLGLGTIILRGRRGKK
ncbi:PEP-CTERM sorting domain-containing protein [Duganella vulcania]|uniref:PEP-CTERM sorting domain-containing protein n=1 Tax=Duganella vulcania TaxID=2692166 RepID=UPI0020C49604|nr:PEP-CTERM sorting domain-containing protein [Duganella vulcania]